MIFTAVQNALLCSRRGETLRLEPWGKDALRVRATMHPEFTAENWALTEAPLQEGPCSINLPEESPVGDESIATITNGRISATVNGAGVMTIRRDGKVVLQDYYRCYGGTISRESRCLKTVNREWKGVMGGGNTYSLTARFEAQKGEKLFGMGQYQQDLLDLKGAVLELAQRNSQITVPFLVSSLGYGLLWNNPAVGKVSFGTNMTEWTLPACFQMDYWITVADEPKQLLQNYTAVTGRAPAFPRQMMGLWQCKLRYRTQEEVLSVARRYAAEGLKIDCIIIDFFHWTVQGDWKFDKTYWPDPKAMVDELHRMGLKVIVSVWPSVDRRSEHFYEMQERGFLIRTERGAMQTYDYQGDCVEIDVFNPAARQYIWDICKKNYYDLGIDAFWLDNSEPDYGVYDFDHYRYFAGPALCCSSMYPQLFARAFLEPMKADGNDAVCLLRSCWAGSQKYANVIWSGDVPSTFESLRDQLQAGLNIGLAGIPWWNTDIGGFMTDDVNDPDFRQLLIRWFQFAVFTPVFRLHGDRGPYNIPQLDERDWGGGYLHTGQNNEMWSYGEEAFAVMKKYHALRLKLQPYLQSLFEEASCNGSPLMRTMFYEFPEDACCWELRDQYMFGKRYLVAPILQLNQWQRRVYLPAGKWQRLGSDTLLYGEQWITAEAPLEDLPVFERMDL